MDLKKQLAAVQRTVGKQTLDSGAEGRSVNLSQTYAIDAAQLWEKCTRADEIKAWFAPVSGDLQLGGRYQVQGNAGGTVEECRPLESYRLTWELDDSTSWVQVRVSPDAAGDPNQSRLELTHLVPVNEHWENFGAGAGGVGWDMAFAGLAACLAKIKIGSDWFNEEPTKEFLTGCSEAWGEAAVRGGEDPEVAKAAVEQSTAFYVPPATDAD